MKKKYLLIIPLICVCTIFCFLLYWKNKPGKSELIVKCVIEHKDELREYIENTKEGQIIKSIDGINGIPGVGKFINITDMRSSSGILVFECVAEGILTSSIQSGFYYSEEDKYSCNALPWTYGYDWYEVPTEVENVWHYETSSDDYYDTVKICENFYYFSAGN